MGSLFLLLTIIAETLAVLLMKLSNGFQHKLPAFAAIFCYLLSFVFLTYALKKMPVGIANALWAGTSTVLVAFFGVLILKEQLSGMQVLFLSLIVIGLAGLHFSGSA